jgi:hypothetical protein
MERDEAIHERNHKNSFKCMCWVRRFSRIYPPLSINAARVYCYRAFTGFVITCIRTDCL